MDDDLNPGIVIGAAAAVLSVFAALAALYLWAVNRARQRLNQTATPQERAVIPWLRPLLLPTLLILCLGMVAQLAKAFEEKSWPEASNIIITSWAAFMILMFWLKRRKKPRNSRVMSGNTRRVSGRQTMHTRCGMVTRLIAASLLILVAAGAGPWLALPATAAPVYRAFVNIDNVSCFVCNDQEFTVMDDGPVEAEATGQFNARRGVARAKAGPGFLEAFGSAQNQGNPNPFGSPIIHTRFASSASVNADLFFSSPPGSTVEELPVRLNMHLAGVFGFTAANDDAQTAGVTVEFTLPGPLTDGNGTNIVEGDIEIIRADGVTTEIDREGLLADVQAVDETDPMGDFARVIRINANITTPEFVIPMNVPTNLGIAISIGGQQSSSLGFGRLSADFERTLRFANDRPVFDLPAGYTANSAALGIVDNQYVVPEPATAVLLGLAVLGGLAGRARSRWRGGHPDRHRSLWLEDHSFGVPQSSFNGLLRHERQR